MYQEIILDHYRNPHHRGLREPFDAEVHHVNPTCGDEVTAARPPRDGDTVADVSYDGHGLLDQPGVGVGDDRPGHRPAGRRGAGRRSEEFLDADAGRGRAVEPDEDVLDDAVAFAGVVEVPGAGQVRAAGLDGVEGRDRAGRLDAARARPPRQTA